MVKEYMSCLVLLIRVSYMILKFSIASSGFRDGVTFTGFGKIDYDLEQKPSGLLFEAGQYQLLNWNDINGSLIIEFSGFIAKCKLSIQIL